MQVWVGPLPLLPWGCPVCVCVFVCGHEGCLCSVVERLFILSFLFLSLFCFRLFCDWQRAFLVNKPSFTLFHPHFLQTPPPPSPLPAPRRFRQPLPVSLPAPSTFLLPRFNHQPGGPTNALIRPGLQGGGGSYM